jgi:uncharacterized membrane protein YqaE (UPF0057 family)
MKKGFFIIAVLLLGTMPLPYTTQAAVVINPVTENTASAHPDPGKLKEALEEFKRLSRKEKKERFREIKKEIRKYKAAKRAGSDVDTNTLLLVILALLLPPLAVYLHQGEANTKFWITFILFLAGIVGVFTLGWYAWLASVVYALIVVLGGA